MINLGLARSKVRPGAFLTSATAQYAEPFGPLPPFAVGGSGGGGRPGSRLAAPLNGSVVDVLLADSTGALSGAVGCRRRQAGRWAPKGQHGC